MVVSRTITCVTLRARRQPQCECQQKGSTPMILLANVAAGWMVPYSYYPGYFLTMCHKLILLNDPKDEIFTTLLTAPR